MATGKSYRKGQTVPPDFPISDFMLKAGAIAKMPDNSKVPETISSESYDNMTYKELGKLMEERGLGFERNKDARIARLKDGDK